ncbi:MAG TPA: nucleotide exchange factor GrpE [Pyrinomonadaceae bacterium]|nr:nucleotide exchange factor GrpE [Pyrinomonadaceae bacterium]
MNSNNEQDYNPEPEEQKQTDDIPAQDERRFNTEGERVRVEVKDDAEKSKQNVKSQRETELENRLKEETTRREAAEAKLVGVQAKFEEIKTDMERETQEMRSRMQKSLEDRAKQGQFNFLTSLLPVLDNLNRAIQASETDASFEHLLDGVKGTARSFEQALISVGVEAIPATGMDFNPELHEAIDMVPVDAGQDGKITAEYSRGYKFGERLLRPSKVQVGRGK